MNVRLLSIRSAGALGLIAGGAFLAGSADRPVFTEHDKAFYASPNLVNFVRPGLSGKIVEANIAADGTITARIKLTDPKNQPLDREGNTTPGPITTGFIAAFIAKGDAQYTAYTMSNRTLKAADGSSVNASLPATDSGGAWEKLGEGDYRYTFKTKAPAGYDRTVTHTIGLTTKRDLTEFDMGTQFDNDVFTFVPDGSTPTVVRDIVRTDTCNQRCHDPLAVHGGNRRDVRLCVLCHQQQNHDAAGLSLSLPVLIHKIHRGEDLPSVQSGKPFQILLSRPVDFSDVVFPAGVRNCEVCHDPNSGAKQADAWLKPNRQACGACHDDVNFATGENHSSANMPEISDHQCANCHISQGELEYDPSIRGAHLDPRFSASLPGTTFEILKVDNGVAGKQPTVTFTVKDKAGNPIKASDMTRLSLVLAGPAADYSKATPEDARKAQGPGQDGSYTYTFQAAIPADAKGTFSVGIEGYCNWKINPGTKDEVSVRDAGMNKVTYFSVDGSTATPRRQVVAIEKCNACHLKLTMHGENRNQIEHCVQCHNPNATDAANRPADQQPGETIAFKTMIHRIHTGEDLAIPYSIYGHGGPSDMTKVVFPGDRRNCGKCHVNGSEQLPLQDGLLSVQTPREAYTPLGPTAAACLGCHTDSDCYAHAYSMTTPIGEACGACHGAGADFSVNRVHAR